MLMTAFLGACLLATPALAAAPETVIQDDAVFLHQPEAEIRDAYSKIRSMGIDRVRLTAGWSVIAPDPDSATRPNFDATDPAAYPAGSWMNVDRAVRLAHEAGVKVMIDIAFWAPRWATKSAASETHRLRTHIDPGEFALFSRAVARRYSGTYTPPVTTAAPAPQKRPDEDLLVALFGKGAAKSQPAPAPASEQPDPLPAVDIFTVWNEPNHPGFLQPQWEKRGNRWIPRSPGIYRGMLRASYPAIKAEAPNSKVLIGGTASMGSSQPGKSGVPPLRFLRELACVDSRNRPITTGDCASYESLPGDGWAHHPYSLQTTPDHMPKDVEKLPVAATGRLADTLRKLVAAKRLAAGNKNLYMTEYGYETGPPDPQAPFRPEQQAQLLAWAEFLGTRDRSVKMWPQFLLRDRPGVAAGPRQRAFGDWQSGLIYEDGTMKPAGHAFRTPVFAQCASRGRVMVWGRLRGGAEAHVRVDVETRKAGWRAAPSAGQPTAKASRASVRVAAGGHEVKRFVKVPRGARVRIAWTTADGAQTAAPAVAPVGCGRGAQKG